MYCVSIAAGAPFAAKQTGGYHVLEGPTGGYLMGFILAGGLIGYLAERGWDRHWLRCALVMILGNMIIYAAGLLWLPWGASFISPSNKTPGQIFCGAPRGCVGNVLWAGLVPFLPGDAIKIALAWAALQLMWRLVTWIDSHMRKRKNSLTVNRAIRLREAAEADPNL